MGAAFAAPILLWVGFYGPDFSGASNSRPRTASWAGPARPGFDAGFFFPRLPARGLPSNRAGELMSRG